MLYWVSSLSLLEMWPTKVVSSAYEIVFLELSLQIKWVVDRRRARERQAPVLKARGHDVRLLNFTLYGLMYRKLKTQWQVTGSMLISESEVKSFTGLMELKAELKSMNWMHVLRLHVLQVVVKCYADHILNRPVGW